MDNLTVVMYHYVRPIRHSKFPGIKGLELDAFKRQLDYFSQNHSIVTVDQIKASITRGVRLPENACWLTFDDGYKDHFDYVLPELMGRGIQGTFFPAAAAVLENRLLDVNAVHHVLACAPDVSELRGRLDRLCEGDGIGKQQLAKLWQTLGKSNRWDDAETIYVKRLLQHALPEALRNALTKELFQHYLGQSPDEFSSQLYMSCDEVAMLVSSGMSVGSHGFEHYWLNKISSEAQEHDLSRSLEFLDSVGAPVTDWVICYPYGGYNTDTLKIAAALGAFMGVTIDVAQAELSIENKMVLPRFDTNDFPQ